MTRHLRLGILTLLVAVLPAVAARADNPDQAAGASKTTSGPKAVVDQPIIDKGTVPSGGKVEAAFTIRNEGNTPLEITRVQPTCGCTVADFDKTVPPGGSGTVTARVDTSHMTGPIAKTINVFTNDPASPRLQLTVKSDVRPFLSARPGYARFTSLVHGEKDEHAEQVVWAEEFDDLQVLGVDSPKPYVEVSFHEASADEREADLPGRQWIVEVQVDKSAPTGPIAEYVIVKTNDPQQAELRIPVSGFVRPVIGVTPPDVRFGDVDPSKGQSWGVLVRRFGSTPLELGSYHSTVPGLDVEVQPIKEGEQYKVILTPTPKMAQGEFTGQLEIETNLPLQKTIDIALKGKVIAAGS